MRSLRSALCCALLSAGLAACSSSPQSPDGGTPASKVDGGTTSKSDGGGGPTQPIELTSVTARVAGRTGRDLRLSIAGSDQDLDAVSLWVRVLGASGSPLSCFDTDKDGAPDTESGAVALEDVQVNGKSFTATAVIRRAFDRAPGAAKIAVRLQDAYARQTAEQIVTIAKQPVLPQGAQCDATYVAARCDTGLSCRGSPATCQEGVAPQITRLAFLKTTSGPSILIEGTEPEEDLDKIQFGFQNAQGQAVAIDADGDGNPDLASFDFDARDLSADGAFFIRMQPADGLDQQAPKLTATPSDVAGHSGTLKTTSPTPTPSRSSGQSCDPRGFDTCAASLACSPGILGKANKCQPAASLRTTRCGASAELTPSAEGVTALGVAAGGSLWDVPLGCQTYDPKGRPEGAVRLHLATAATRLTLSTDHPGTNFDTVLYLLPGCPNDVFGSLGCNDEGGATNSSSTLVLTDVPAGDYLVVIDSFDHEGGCWELLGEARVARKSVRVCRSGRGGAAQTKGRPDPGDRIRPLSLPSPRAGRGATPWPTSAGLFTAGSGGRATTSSSCEPITTRSRRADERGAGARGAGCILSPRNGAREPEPSCHSSPRPSSSAPSCSSSSSRWSVASSCRGSAGRRRCGRPACSSSSCCCSPATAGRTWSRASPPGARRRCTWRCWAPRCSGSSSGPSAGARPSSPTPA
ncbi:MAG: hypothetical protein QM765_40945 [Myxococcales bacterium]